MTGEIKRQAQLQFGAHAEEYVASPVHSKGYSLGRMIEIIKPDQGWTALDVATGGGHTALALAQAGVQVIASDLTAPMLHAARQHIQPQGAARIVFCAADAEDLPYPGSTFDCVTCRIAAHHFPNVQAFVRESARVLKPGGILAVVDNISSGEPAIARYYNDFEKLRDPSHNWAYSIDDWDTFFFSEGLKVFHKELVSKEIDFDVWASRMGVTGSDLVRLRVLLLRAPQQAASWLQPREKAGRVSFILTEGIIAGRKPGTI